jgi:hypothetical protein
MRTPGRLLIAASSTAKQKMAKHVERDEQELADKNEEGR